MDGGLQLFFLTAFISFEYENHSEPHQYLTNVQWSTDELAVKPCTLHKSLFQ